jgi:hypothetical protein
MGMYINHNDTCFQINYITKSLCFFTQLGK